ncbi:hypothetical protein PLESTM_001556000 [Pleodorina starrii]|nr:hypothetical protein PLESTM_001556000 [Pleodorina starrii]
MAPTAADYARAREAFPYFQSEQDADIAFMENAGGSQVPRCVVDAISEFFCKSYAQLGAGYGRSQRATRTVEEAHSWLEVFMNTKGQGQVVIGPSTSQLAFNLASAFADVLGPGDSIVLQEASHESVLGPWVRLAGRNGCQLRWWRADRRSGASALSDLEASLDLSTRLVVVTHVSNILGEILDLASVVRLVRARAPGAQVVADGVAYAPHRAIDVAAWGVDWYLFSAYKVYGPHVGVMYGRRQAYDSLLARGGQGPNHYFVSADDLTYKFELGGANHEACAGLLALQDYLLHLLDQPHQPHQQQQQHQQSRQEQQQQQGAQGQQQQKAAVPSETPEPAGGSHTALRLPRVSRAEVEAAFALMEAMEQPLQERLLSYLASHPAVRLVGPSYADPAVRVPTVSFVHRSKSSAAVARDLQTAGFSVRCGHMYARRLLEALAEEGGLLAQEAAARQRSAGGDDLNGGDGTAAAAAAADAGGGGAASAAFDVRRAVDEGVVRVTLLHYNTPEEVARLIAALETVL